LKAPRRQAAAKGKALTGQRTPKKTVPLVISTSVFERPSLSESLTRSLIERRHLNFPAFLDGIHIATKCGLN
jgi:hypothetical protein